MTRDVSPRFRFHLTTAMSMTTSTHTGHSGPRTPPRGQAPEHAKSSPVSKVPAYFLPENREQYQMFGYNPSFMLGPFDKQEFLEFLNGELPKSVPDMGRRERESFVKLANNVARYVKSKREHCLFLYLGFLPTYYFHFRLPKPRSSSVP